MKAKVRILLTMCALTWAIIPSFTQVNNVEFGKNRVQYHDDFEAWQQYESRNFISYFYGKSRPTAEAAIMLAEYHHDAVQKMLEHRINDKIELIIYTDITDVKQSNIGNEELFSNTGGHTKIVGNKIFVYSTGNMNELARDIRQGIAQVYLNNMMFGSNLQEIVQNAVLLNLPAWFEDGLVAYAGESWNTSLDARLRDVFLHNKYKSFQAFADEEPMLAGHSMWFYVTQQYGNASISDLLYLSRMNRSAELGMSRILGVSFESLTEAWNNFFDDRYKKEMPPEELPGELVNIKNRKNLPITAIAMSPDGQQIAYSVNNIGRIRVFLYDLQTGKQKRIFKTGQRNALQATDYNYPLLDWRPDGQGLAILYERRDKMKLRLYETATDKYKESLIPERYTRIYDMDFFSNQQLAFSAATNGYSDLFLYRINTRQSTQLTQDYYSDLHVCAVSIDSVPGLLFASNRDDQSKEQGLRLDTTLPTGQFDIYYLRMPPGQPQQIIRVTNTPLANESYPVSIDSTWFSYLTDASGKNMRALGFIETYLSHYNQRIYFKDGTTLSLHADTSLAALDSSQIDSIRIVPVWAKRAVTKAAAQAPYHRYKMISEPRSKKMLELHTNQEGWAIRQLTIDTTAASTALPTTQYMADRRLYQPAPKAPESSPQPKAVVPPSQQKIVRDEKPVPVPNLDTVPVQKQDTGKVDIENYFFQSEFEDEDDNLFERLSQPEQDKIVDSEDELISLRRLEEQAAQPNKLTNRKRIRAFIPSRIVPYRLRFRMDYFTTQMDNSLLFDGLDGYSGIRPEFDFMPAGVLLKANFKDLLEDHVLEGGVRIPLSFNGNEFFVVYENRKKRIDKRFALYRRSIRDGEDLNTNELFRVRENTILGMFQLRYPIDIYRSIRLTTTVRHDETIQLATDRNSLEVPTDRQQRLGIRLAYVYDNTLQKDINLLNGTRLRVYTEAVKRFKIDFGSNENFQVGNGIMGILGFDVRHYQPFLKHSVLAARIAGETSSGPERIIYYLGGTDGWLFPSFNEGLNYPPTGEFAFQTLATSMRGFQQNIRYGTSFALANVEARIPIVKYFDKRVQNTLLRHLQFNFFFDAGTAWEGSSPFSDDNPLNTETFSNNKVSVTVNYFRDPIVFGYGAGLRTMVFGYFVRFDYAWGIESRTQLKPRIHFSLGTDF